MPSFECKRLPCLVVRLLISSCPIGTNRTLYPFLHRKGRFCDEMGHFCDEMGHFCTLRPSSTRLHAFYLHLTLFACTALIFNALRRVGYAALCLHTLCTLPTHPLHCLHGCCSRLAQVVFSITMGSKNACGR